MFCFFSSRRRHTRCALVTGVQTCALPICPAHPDGSPSLTIREGHTGAPLVYCQAGCAPEAVIGALRGLGLWEGRGDDYTPPSPAEARQRAAEEEADRQRRLAYALDLWRRSVPIADTVAERYLRERGIIGPLPPTLRYLAGAKHGPTGLILPGPLGAVTRRPDRQVHGIHRPFLTADGLGKEPVSDATPMLGEWRGGAVRLAPHGEVLTGARGREAACAGH